jgi:hypothetical protein
LLRVGPVRFDLLKKLPLGGNPLIVAAFFVDLSFDFALGKTTTLQGETRRFRFPSKGLRVLSEIEEQGPAGLTGANGLNSAERRHPAPQQQDGGATE